MFVSGALATSGIFVLPEGSRVADVILAAGGFVTGAEKDYINLAAQLTDGQQIDPPGTIITNHVNEARVNINTASISELNALPGIGLTTSQAIVDFRIRNGPFQFIQDIQIAPGIGFATYDCIKDYISTGP